MNRWLRREGAIPIGKLAEQVGLHLPTAAQALQRLGERQYLLRRSNRSVELRSFPQTAWNELLVLRTPGGSLSAMWMLRAGDPISNTAQKVGANQAARTLPWAEWPRQRHWHQDFDLHGIPRIDLSLHVPQGRMNLDFMRKLDPALERFDKDDSSAAVVIHPLFRNESLLRC